MGVAARIAAIPDHTVDQLAAAHGGHRAVDTEAGGGIAIQAQLLDFACHAQVIGIFPQQAPAAELGHEPHAIGQVRHVGRAAVVQAQAVGITIVWSAVVAFVVFKIIDVVMGLRVPEDQEREGLDVSSHGETAYHD